MRAPFVVHEVPFALVRQLLGAMRADGLAIEPIEGVWLGAFASGDVVAGVARLSAQDGVAFLDDVWVQPDLRRRGAGGALVAFAVERGTPLWLICDEDAVAYYAARGFARVPLERFPPPLAAYFGGKGEWPEASDHVHVAMIAR